MNNTDDIAGGAPPSPEQEFEAAILEVPLHLREIARKRGLELLSYVVCGINASQAATVLMQLAAKHSSNHGQLAVQMLQGAYNTLAQRYAEASMWKQEDLSTCYEEILAAERSRIQLAEPCIIVPTRH